MYRFLVLLLFLFSIAHAAILKEREPHFQPNILESDEEGNPLHVLYTVDGRPVKEIFFYADGKAEEELDLNAEGMAEGCAVRYYPSGSIAEIACYKNGIIDGELRTFYPTGDIEGISHYKKGKKEGLFLLYYATGEKKEEAHYLNDQSVREKITYYEDGAIASRTPFSNGLPDGKACEWYPKAEGGGVKRTLLYSKGVLNGDGRGQAYLAYSATGVIIESQDFKSGLASGLHTKSTENGASIYKVFYTAGKKEGKEEFFSNDGKPLGGGLYKAGREIGEHILYYPSGKLKRRSVYSKEEPGKLIEPICEYSEDGKCLSRFLLVLGEKEGLYETWYANGTPKERLNYSNGKLHGRAEEYYENGKLKRVCHMQEGEISGLEEEWYESGAQKWKKSYAHGMPQGEHLSWSEKGTLLSRAKYLNGKRDGLFEVWTDKGELLFSANYIEGVPDGPLIQNYADGKPLRRTVFNKGMREGFEKKWHANGKLASEGTFKNNLLDGPFRSYYPDGSPEKEFEFEKGLPRNVHKEFYPASMGGGLSRIYRFSDGKFEGIQEAFFEDGKLAAKLTYEKGLLNGPKMKWAPDGTVIEEGIYVNGKIEGLYKLMNQEGELIVSNYKNGLKNGAHQIFYPLNEDGARVKRLEANFKDDKLEGEVSEYLESGSKVASMLYENGLLEGRSVIYFANGAVSGTVDYIHNKREGKSISYFPHGKVQQELFFKNDLRNGEERIYFDNGKLASLYHFKDDEFDGLCQEWNPKGTLIFEAEYRNGRKHGKFCKYYEDGSPRLVASYADDAIVSEKKTFKR